MPITYDNALLNASLIIDYTVRSDHNGMSGVYVTSDRCNNSTLGYSVDWASTNVVDGLYYITIGF